MKRFVRFGHLLGAFLLALVAIGGGARAADLSEPVILVATSALDGSPFAQTVVVAAPIPNGRHIGFIINKPTNLKLATLFPDDVAARRVDEPVYLGGPGLIQGVFAVTRNVPEGGGTVVPLMPGLFVVIDGAAVDRLIASTPNDARYFMGIMLWDEDELEEEVSNSAWDIRPADVDTVLRAKSNGLWNSLRAPTASIAFGDREPA